MSESRGGKLVFCIQTKLPMRFRQAAGLFFVVFFKETAMKKEALFVVIAGLLSVHLAVAAPPTPTQTDKTPVDRSVQVYKKSKLMQWNREKAGGGEGPLLGEFAYTRHQTDDQDAFREAGWLTLPKGASIGLHKHIDNEDIYIIVSGKGLFTDSNNKETRVGPGDITIARPGQSHALKNIGSKPLVFINVVAQRAPSAVNPAAGKVAPVKEQAK